MPTPILNAALNAQNVYSSIGKKIATAPAPQDTNAFEQILSHLQSTRNATQMAEKKGLEAIAGKADIVDVVNAMTQAEIAVETLVSVRDKVIETYREIINMPI